MAKPSPERRLAEDRGPEDGASDREETYGLIWPGKARAKARIDAKSVCRAVPLPGESLAWETTGHQVIEGDNLEALHLLRESLAGRVQLIYIDPPYNTGNDFAYPDDYRASAQAYLERTGQRSSAGRQHAPWLDMMYPRLALARDLLAEEGVIAVSIDHHEVFNLRHLLDELYGGENLVAELCVSLNPKGRQLSRFFATSHEYLVIYAKAIERCALEASTAEAVDPAAFPLSDAGGRYRRLPLRNTNKKFNPSTRPNLYFPLYVDEASGAIHLEPGAGRREVLPVFGDGAPAVWRWSTGKVAREWEALVGRTVRGRGGPRLDVFQKDYLTADRKKKLRSVWLSSEVGSTDAAVEEVKRLLGPVFQTAKPTGLIRQLLRLMPEDALVLDFFAGSGTTGHAVLAENAADGGRRRYVLVQSRDPLDPELPHQRAGALLCDRLGRPRTIAELTKERLRRVAAELPAGEGADLGFRVLRLE